MSPPPSQTLGSKNSLWNSRCQEAHVIRHRKNSLWRGGTSFSPGDLGRRGDVDWRTFTRVTWGSGSSSRLPKTLRTIFGCLLAYQSRPLNSTASVKGKRRKITRPHFLHFPENTDSGCDMWVKTLMPTFPHTTSGTRKKKIIVIY